jgi:hypothetical protein
LENLIYGQVGGGDRRMISFLHCLEPINGHSQGLVAGLSNRRDKDIEFIMPCHAGRVTSLEAEEKE